jgi:non-specific protein-tyrosine kinase
MLALFRHRLDIRFKSPREFEAELHAPVLGAVPHVSGWRKTKDSLVLATSPQTPAAEAFRTLATNLRYAAKEHGIGSVLVTSAVRDEGKSTTSANLAVAMAQAGMQVLLISADLRRPSLHQVFDVENDGIVDVVTGSKPIDDVVQELGVPNLEFIGSGPAPRDPAALLGSQQTSHFFQSVRELGADFVIVDAPPTLAVADASILSPYTDGVLYVLDARSTTRLALVHARDQLKNARASVIGGVYNNFDVDTSYPDYRHGYYVMGADDRQQLGNGKAKEPVSRWTRLSR